MDSDEPRRSGPRRAPVSRQGRRQPAPRRTAPGRAGGPRRPDPSQARRKGTPRPGRPVPPPRTPIEDDESAYPGPPGHHDPSTSHEAPGYRDPSGYRDSSGYRDPSGYRDSSGYRDPSGYRDSAGHQEASGYRDLSSSHEASGYDDAYGYSDASAYHDASAAGAPPVPGHPRGPGGKSKRRGGKPKRRGRPGKGRPAGQVRQSGPAPREGGLGAKLYFGAAAVLGLLVLLGVGTVVVLGGGESAPDAGDAANVTIGTPAETGLSPASYSSSSSSSAYSGIASRSADQKPLTADEVFPTSAAKLAVPDGEARVKLRAKRLDGDCAAAVWGSTVGEALGEGGCTQAARGIYSDTETGYALAVAVFNLAGSADADRFVATLEKTIGAGFVRPLEAPAPLDDFGRGFGMARGLAMGHFAVVTWAQRLDGKGGPEDETLLSLLIEGGKNPAVLGRAARTSD
ncbi:hypothetical protein [Spirillospora sp. NPDC048819]|uniref:hypothetical protein n=1 Tax=Spirillospora sp. NPDC048819 TaxID=3155268 RepID=UPI0034058474